MADTGFKYASASAVGSGEFTNPSNLLGAPDTLYATRGGMAINTCGLSLTNGSLVRIYVLPLSSPSDTTSGCSTDLWGASQSASTINDSSFGVLYHIDPSTNNFTIILKGYGFSIPTSATINGIEVVARNYYTSGRISTTYSDSVGIKVYYTEGAGSTTKPQYYYAQQ